MFNKTDTAKSSDAQKPAAPIRSQQVTNSIVQLPNKPTNATADNSLVNRVNLYFQRLSLGTKATMLAIAIGTVPVVVIGAIAYNLANKSITQQITQTQESEATSLSDKVNRFMFERYGDIQVLSNLPVLINSKVRDVTTPEEKQAIIGRFTQSYKVYDSIVVLDLNGNPLITTTTGEEISNQKDEDYFQTTLQKDSVIITQPQISKGTGKVNIYIASPVKDSVTGKTIAVVRTRLPVTSVDELIKNYAANGHEYHLIDESGKFFVAAEKNQIGRNAQKDFPGLDRLQAVKKVNSFITVDQIDNQPQLVSYVPSRKLEGLPDLKWEVVVATDTAVIFEPQRQLLQTIGLGTAVTALIVAAIAAWLAKRATTPILQATETVTKLGEGQLNTRLEIQTEDELGVLGTNINQMADQLQVLINEQELDAERAKLLADITLKIRRNLKTEDIYKTTVRELRQALKTDRVIIYKFNQDTWDGKVVAESVSGGWPKMLGVQIDDPCFRERHVETYKDGRVRAIANIYQEPSLANAACYIKILEDFAVKGNLIAPIVTHEQLTGLLIAHHCDSPRIWEQPEIDFFKQIAIQIGYALEQANLLEEVEQARANAEQDTEDERRQKQSLQMQLLELLSDVEGAASGDLTVRADVTAGEIGTVADFFNSIVESLRDIVTQVKVAATQVNAAIGSNEYAIRHLADEALLQAAEINRTLDAVDQMTYSIQAVAKNAQQAAVIANHAAQTATKSGQAMDLTVQNILSLRETVGETAKKVKRLGESSQQISRVVSLINQIAMQTNLLAINAGIEAARAGEEGQGFAVVAEEVGELAARSAAATKEIEQIVENIQRETSEVVQAMEVGTTQVVEGTRIVEDAKNSLSEILEVSRQIDDLVQTISIATTSQVETSQAVSHLMKDIAAVSQRTSDSSRHVSESLQQTVEISQELQKTVGTFKVS